MVLLNSNQRQMQTWNSRISQRSQLSSRIIPFFRNKKYMKTSVTGSDTARRSFCACVSCDTRTILSARLLGLPHRMTFNSCRFFSYTKLSSPLTQTFTFYSDQYLPIKLQQNSSQQYSINSARINTNNTE